MITRCELGDIYFTTRSMSPCLAWQKAFIAFLSTQSPQNFNMFYSFSERHLIILAVTATCLIGFAHLKKPSKQNSTLKKEIIAKLSVISLCKNFRPLCSSKSNASQFVKKHELYFFLKSVSTRAPGSRSTCHLTNFDETLPV